MSDIPLYYVTSLEDTNEPNTLRYALNQANQNIYSKIICLVNGTIKLTKCLPCVKKTIFLDGTQITGFNKIPLIEIDCNQYCGLILEGNSQNSTIQGFSITNAKKSGITLKTNNNTIQNNFLGLDLNGNPKGNCLGICLLNCSNNTIGSNPNNISGYASNVISANKTNGITLINSHLNTIISNFIGTNPDGKLSLPNLKNGIYLEKSNENKIGGTVYTNSDGITNNPTGNKGTVPIVYIFPPLGNLISGNKHHGIEVYQSNTNVFNGNFIGTDVSGIKTLSNHKNGVFINSSKNNVLRGCTVDENPFVYYNVCSGNNENGIQVSNSDNTIIQGNFFGIGASNADIVSNKLNGILVDGNSYNTVIGGIIPLGNVSSGNGKNGVKITDNATRLISFNTFTGLFAFQGAAPNGEDGMYVDSVGKEIVARTCVLSGNKKNGIHLAGKSEGVVIEKVICGLLTKGDGPLPNGENGLLISGYSKNNVIGVREPSVIPRSAFSGNKLNGIHLTDCTSKNTINLGFIGLSVTGQDKGCQNLGNGILIDKNAKNNFIGSLLPNPKILTNYIAANEKYGLEITGKAKCNKIIGNVFNSTINDQLAKNVLGDISNTSKCTNIIKNNITQTKPSEIENLAFYFYENNDQNNAVSPVDSKTILQIPYKTNWGGQRYLLSSYDPNTQVYKPFKLKNIKELSFTVDLTNSQFNANDNCNFNCYFVSSNSTNNPNSQEPPINNTQYVPSANYYDAAAADGGRYGVEFDIFETNSGNTNNAINFFQQTGHFNTSLLNGTATTGGAQCITFSSDSNFNTEPTNPGNGAPNTNFRTNFTNGKTINVKVNFSNPDFTDETTISFNGTVVWNSKWLVGGTWSQWPTASPSGTYPCSTIGTLVPFSNITKDTATNNTELTLETINNSNKAGLWLFFGMNPYYSPPIDAYQANHSGANSANGSGGNINIQDFTFSTWT